MGASIHDFSPRAILLRGRCFFTGDCCATQFDGLDKSSGRFPCEEKHSQSTYYITIKAHSTFWATAHFARLVKLDRLYMRSVLRDSTSFEVGVLGSGPTRARTTP